MSVIKPALLYPERIIYLSGANNYSWICFQDGEKKLLAKPISYLEELLPDFIRVHKTALINPTYVQSLHEPPHRKMSGKVQLNSGDVFPVSRRRWQQVVDALQNHTTALATQELLQPPTFTQPESAVVSPAPAQATRSVFLISQDREMVTSVEHVVQKKWPGYVVQTSANSVILPDIWGQMPASEHPILLLLDARTITLERLNTLQRLKNNKTLGRIPVILLTSATDQAIVNGYQYKANSVVAIPPGTGFIDAIFERVFQYWLRIVTLPSMAMN
ncbi:response regulator transcription factor [Spirosoma panaciterrae]|uniref:response regulator transcription factor n=1 Tax=Spirosoma panaciterrae TaxID=496058 RepID=UPI0003640E10|nr:LytTR family transcriptional regulator DNA-binding domain-containing protein [Spirosoma panaciterrae]